MLQLVVPAERAPAGLDAPEGFEVTLFAGDDLAHNIYSMTIDSLGRVVVAGPNYVKILIDENGDGRADRAATFSSLPSSGAHGLHFLGRDLVFTGDNMLGVLRDADGDDVADGPPEPWARLRHPEHGANGIVQGPDGWLYVVCGNDAGVGREHASAATSGQGSTLQRHLARGAGRTGDGGRRPASQLRSGFGELGQLFTVDSDGERDHHLPVCTHAIIRRGARPGTWVCWPAGSEAGIGLSISSTTFREPPGSVGSPTG